MKRRYSYKDCYLILNIEPGCSWDELRKAYKIQIQKWHPDRFPDESPEKQAADEKIRRITAANQQLVAFYRKHGALPDPEKESIASALPRPNNQAQNAPKSASIHAAPTGARKKDRPSLFPIIVLVSTIVFIVWTYTPYTQKSSDKNTIGAEPQRNELRHKQSANQNQLSSPANKLENKANSTSRPGTTPNEEIISYGSTVGAVIAIQGPPTRQMGDTWYYGDSEIYFLDGKVIGWRHMPGSALKISMDNADSNKSRNEY